MNLDDLAKSVHSNAKQKGFWDYMYPAPVADTFVFYAKQIAMIHSEATEVLEALRKSKGPEEVVEELADIIIRVVDLYEGLKFTGEVNDSLEDTLVRKTITNQNRPRLHGVLG